MMRELTGREWQVFQLMAKGRTTREIADLLCVSIYTARNHIATILRKLEARNRMEAVYRVNELTRNPSERVLALCKGAGIPVTDRQGNLIRKAFST